MPADLPEVAQREWKRVVPELLHLGVLTRIDGKALAGYCAAFARWLQAEADVTKYGLIVEEPVLLVGMPTGFVRLKRNPAISVAHDAMKIMKSFLVEFGMTPAARSRIRIEKPKEVDPLEAYLQKGSGNPAKHVN